MSGLLPIRIYKVAERSMEPRIKEGSYVIVNCWNDELIKGDIVVLRSPEENRILVKRIEKSDNEGLFLTGDNKKISRDSRAFGKISADKIIGKVMLTI